MVRRLMPTSNQNRAVGQMTKFQSEQVVFRINHNSVASFGRNIGLFRPVPRRKKSLCRSQNKCSGPNVPKQTNGITEGAERNTPSLTGRVLFQHRPASRKRIVR